jgi:hypothetical protein
VQNIYPKRSLNFVTREDKQAGQTMKNKNKTQDSANNSRIAMQPGIVIHRHVMMQGAWVMPKKIIVISVKSSKGVLASCIIHPEYPM